MGDSSLKLRFRHVSGDLGPFTFEETVLVSEVKEKLLAEWPTEGPIAKEAPSKVDDIKLILSGKFLDGTKPLSVYRRDMGVGGVVGPEEVVTMHCVVRVSATAAEGKKHKHSSGAAAATGDAGAGATSSSSGCGCVIC